MLEEVLEKYDLTVEKLGRAKGAMVLETAKGTYLLKEWKGESSHLEFEEKLLNDIAEYSDIIVDNIVRNVDGEIISEGKCGQKYVLRKWYVSKDMESKNISQNIKAAGLLGRLHNTLNEISKMPKIQEYYCDDNIDNEQIEEMTRLTLYESERHNLEMKRTRNYIRKKINKNKFELMVLESFDKFYEEALQAERNLCANEVRFFIQENMRERHIIHGAYNYHNLILVGDKMAVTNFGHSKRGLQVRDLYDYLRKVMEKHNWSSDIGIKLIKEYQKNRRLSWEEMQYLVMKLTYPEKYWKILNHYMNNKKAWLPDKDVIKLRIVVEQREKRREFVEKLKCAF